VNLSHWNWIFLAVNLITFRTLIRVIVSLILNKLKLNMLLSCTHFHHITVNSAAHKLFTCHIFSGLLLQFSTRCPAVLAENFAVTCCTWGKYFEIGHNDLHMLTDLLFVIILSFVIQQHISSTAGRTTLNVTKYVCFR